MFPELQSYDPSKNVVMLQEQKDSTACESCQNLKKLNSNFEQENETLLANISSMSNEIINHKVLSTDLEVIISDLRSQNDSHLKRINSLKERVITLNESLDILDKKIYALNTEKEELLKDNDNLTSQKDDLLIKMSDLNAKIDAIKTKKENYKKLAFQDKEIKKIIEESVEKIAKKEDIEFVNNTIIKSLSYIDENICKQLERTTLIISNSLINNISAIKRHDELLVELAESNKNANNILGKLVDSNIELSKLNKKAVDTINTQDNFIRQIQIKEKIIQKKDMEINQLKEWVIVWACKRISHAIFGQENKQTNYDATLQLTN